MRAISFDAGRRGLAEEFTLRGMQAVLHPMRALLAAPSLLFLAAL